MKFKMQSLTDIWKESKLYVMGFVALLGITVGTAFTYQNVIKPLSSTFSISSVKAAGDDETPYLSYSMYDMSAWLSAYYNAATSPTGYKVLAQETDPAEYSGYALLSSAAVEAAKDAEGDDKWSYATKSWFVNTDGVGGKIGGGGSLLGFPDTEVVDGGIIGFLSSKTSASTTDYSFDSLKSGEGWNSLQAYAYYGASLEALGIDSSMNGGIMGWHLIRMLGGAIIWLAYIIVSFVEKLFALAIAILQVTNPFKWFATAMSYTWTTSDAGVLSGLVNLVSSTYKIFANFGWVIMIPIIVSTLIFMLIFTGGGRQNPTLDQKRRNKFRYGLIYFFFLAVGVPFLGTAYTAGLDAMSASFDTDFGANSFSADSVVLSTYVDNSAWIERNRMYLPDSAVVVWDTGAGDVTPQSKAAVRQTALAINALNSTSAKNAQNVTDGLNWNFNDDDSDQPNNVVNVSNILWKYMIGEVYEAGTWETKVKSHLLQQAAGSSEEDLNFAKSLTVSALELTSSREGFQYLGYVNPNVVSEQGGGITVKDGTFFTWKKDDPIKYGSAPNIFLNKGFADGGDGGITITTPNGANELVLKTNSAINTPSPGFNTPSPGFSSDQTQTVTMSYLEMYNYLNSKFTSNKVRVYSTNALTSNFSRESHAEVNQVGSGYVHKFLIWFNSTIMILGLGILAVGYAFGMLIGAFRRYWTVIAAIFTGTLGMQKGMVQATAGTVMLIAETLGTLVIYELVKTFYIGIPSLMEGAFASIGTSGINGTALANLGFGTASTNAFGFIGIIFALILSSIILIWSTLMLLRIRKPILDIMDTTFTGLINKLFYGDGNVPDDAPKGVNPGESGGMNSVVGAVGGAIAGALGSNVDGADGNDGGDGTGWNDSDAETSANGEASSSSGMDDGDGPDARVAASRDTEETGAEVGEQGKLDRSGQLGSGLASSESESENDVSETGSSVGEANQNVGESEDGVDDVASSVRGVNAPVSATSSGSQGSDQSSDVSASDSSPTSISDDDTVSINATQSATSSSPSGGLSPDADNESVGESSPVKSSVDDNDTVQASNVVSMAEGAKRLAEKRGQGTENAQGVQGNESEIAASAQTNAEKVASDQNGEQDISGKQLQQRNANGVGVGESNSVAQAQAQRRARNAVNRGLADGTDAGTQDNESEIVASAQADAEKVASDQNGEQEAIGKQLQQRNANGVGVGESNSVAQAQAQRRARNAVNRGLAEGTDAGTQDNESEIVASAQANAEKVASDQNGEQDISGKQLQQRNANGVGVGESNSVAQAQAQRRARNAVNRGLADGTDAGTQDNESEIVASAQANAEKVASDQNGEQEAIGKQLQQRNANGVGVGESNSVAQAQAQRRARNAVNRGVAEGTDAGTQDNESEIVASAQANAEKVASDQNGEQEAIGKQLQQRNANGVGVGESNSVAQAQAQRRARNAVNRGLADGTDAGTQDNESEIVASAQADAEKVASDQNGEQEAIGKQLQQRNANGVGVGESNSVAQAQAQRRARNAVNRGVAEGTDAGTQDNESEIVASAQADAEKVASDQNGEQDISGKQLQQRNANGVGVGESNSVAQAQAQRRARNAVNRGVAEGTDAVNQALDQVQQGGGTSSGEHAVQTATPSVGDSKTNSSGAIAQQSAPVNPAKRLAQATVNATLAGAGLQERDFSQSGNYTQQANSGLNSSATSVGANNRQQQQATQQPMRQAGAQKVQNTANKVQQKAEQAMNTPVGKAAGAFVGANMKLAQATTKVASPMVNKAVNDIARTAKETMSLSGTGNSNANSNYYDELDDRRNKTRQTANSYEPRQNIQRERTDALNPAKRLAQATVNATLAGAGLQERDFSQSGNYTQQANSGLNSSATSVGANNRQQQQATQQPMRQAGAQKVQNTANKVQQKAEQAMNTPVGKAAGAFVGVNMKLAQATTKVASPMVNKAVNDIARTAKETMSLSGTGNSNANSNYYDELDDRRNKTRQTANSYEPRQNIQRERTDARIRRTSRPR